MNTQMINDATAVLDKTGAPVYTFSRINPDGLAIVTIWKNGVVEAFAGKDIDLKAINGGAWPEDTCDLKKEVIEAANGELRSFLTEHIEEWPEGALVAIFGEGGEPVLTTVEAFLQGG